jgi:hypothetical protein
MDARRRAVKDESPCIGKEDLREMQGHHPPRGGSGDLRERKAQAAPGIAFGAETAEALTKGIREQGTVEDAQIGTMKLIPDP